MYGTIDEALVENYDAFAEQVRDRTITAYTRVRQQLRRSAERNRRDYDVGLKPKQFSPGQ